jgi:tetratricopeptide (TPR) repeat protein
MIGGLTLLAVLIYWPVRQFGVIDYDDPQYLYDNPHIRQGLTAAGVKDAFFNLHYANYDPPLATLSFELDQNLWGLRPGPMHVENVLLHLCSGLLLWRLIYLATGQVNPAFVVAAIFLCHPMHVESVAWLAERKDALSTPLLLGAMIAYVRYCERTIHFSGRPQGGARPFGPPLKGPLVWYALLLILFTTSLFAKAMGVTLPAVLLLMDYWPLRRWPAIRWPRLILEKLPLAAISVGISIVQAFAQQQIGAYSGASLGLFDRAANAIVCYVIYLLKLLVPTDLAVFYPHPGSRPMPAVVASLGLLGLISFFCWKTRKRRPQLIVGWLWFLGTLLPVIGLVQIGSQAMADRYSYFPSIGLSIAIVWLAAGILRPAMVRSGAAVMIIAGYSVMARQQVMYWRDTQSLFAHAATVTEGNSVAYVELGNLAYQRGEVRQAADDYEKAGDDPHALVGLGNCWMASDPDRAISYYRKAVDLRPNSPPFLLQLANALRATGKTTEADQLARQAESIAR